MSEDRNAHLMVTFSGVSNNFLTVKRKFLMIFIKERKISSNFGSSHGIWGDIYICNILLYEKMDGTWDV